VLARWVVVESVAGEPATVAQQAVQRVADLPVDDSLAVYQPNPADRRAQLLEPTPHGRDALRIISVAQRDWANQLGQLKVQCMVSEGIWRPGWTRGRWRSTTHVGFGEGHWFVATGYDRDGIYVRDSTRDLTWTRALLR
jgi:hypothetical protein